MYVLDEGPRDAPVLVLLHGFAGSTHSWSRVTPLLTDTFRVVRPDLLGHGHTGGRAADSPAQVEAVAAELDRLDVRDVTVVGHSFGADVAAGLAVRDAAQPVHRIGRVVIIAQAPDYDGATMPGVGAVMTRRRLSPLFWNATIRPALVPVRMIVRRRAQPGTLAEFGVTAIADLRRLDPAMFRIVLVERRDRLAADPLDAQLARAGLPTRVLVGTADHFYGDRYAPRYEAIGAHVEIVTGGWHALPLQQPETVATFVRDAASS